jgi:alkaline phosphatase D
VVTGDLHTFMASNTKHDYGNLNPLDFDNFVGAEFMTPSVT